MCIRDSKYANKLIFSFTGNPVAVRREATPKAVPLYASASFSQSSTPGNADILRFQAAGIPILSRSPRGRLASAHISTLTLRSGVGH